MSAAPHDPDVAEWMGLDTDVEALILAAAEPSEPEADGPRSATEGADEQLTTSRRRA